MASCAESSIAIMAISTVIFFVTADGLVMVSSTVISAWPTLSAEIKAGVVAAWFNHRRNKMAVPDARYSCFLETKEEHAFFQGWLTEFTDADVASLICPRPLLVQHGKKDRIAHWPQVVEEFEAAQEHYRRLGVLDASNWTFTKAAMNRVSRAESAFLSDG